MNIICKLMDVGIPIDNAHYIVQRLRERADGCVSWLGAHDNNGFPVFGITREKIKVAQYKVHRLLFAAHHPGTQMTGRKVHQYCDHKWCCRIDHMRGT